MKKICIIGIGLIGGSIGMDVKRLKLADRVVGIVRREESIKESIDLGAVDEATLSVEEGVRDSDLIILATPLSKIIPIAEKIKTNALVIDVASVKGNLTDRLQNIIGPFYVGTHPMAGSEKKGVSGSRINLFNNAVCIVTPTEKTDKKALDKIVKFWSQLGSKIIITSAQEHDRIVAQISHLPHLVAASLVNLLVNEQKAKSCIGTGFRDTTRIAASHPALWQEICEWNKEAISGSLKKFITEITQIKEIVDSENWNGLLDKLSKAKDQRDNI